MASAVGGVVEVGNTGGRGGGVVVIPVKHHQASYSNNKLLDKQIYYIYIYILAAAGP